jgi:hypothetical protein
VEARKLEIKRKRRKRRKISRKRIGKFRAVGS